MTRPKPKTKPIPIRLDGEITGRIDRAAKRLVSNRASVIRLAIVHLLPEIEAGVLTLKKSEQK